MISINLDNTEEYNNKKSTKLNNSISDFEMIDSSNWEATQDKNLGFWNNIRKEITDLKNKIKFNIVQIEDKVKLLKTEHQKFRIFSKKYHTNKDTEYQNLIKELNTIIWMSYRRNFEPIVYNNSLYTSDAGWGCMIRTGQMILARGIYCLQIQESKKTMDEIIRETLLLFYDNEITIREAEGLKELQEETIKDNEVTNTLDSLIKDFDQMKNLKCPRTKTCSPSFSIRSICTASLQYDKGAGQWFSNYEIIKIFIELNERHNPMRRIAIFHFPEAEIFIEDIINKCFIQTDCSCKLRPSYSFEQVCDYKYGTRTVDGFTLIDRNELKNECKCFDQCIQFKDKFYQMTQGFLLFISMRHGLDNLEPEYFDSVLNFFKIEGNIGMIGGKESRALYFVGESNRKLIFLDPHFVQECIKTEEEITFETYKPVDYFYLNLEKMTPSITVGLYCSNDVNKFLQLIHDLNNFSKNSSTSEDGRCIFSVKESRKPKQVKNKIQLIPQYYK